MHTALTFFVWRRPIMDYPSAEARSRFFQIAFKTSFQYIMKPFSSPEINTFFKTLSFLASSLILMCNFLNTSKSFTFPLVFSTFISEQRKRGNLALTISSPPTWSNYTIIQEVWRPLQPRLLESCPNLSSPLFCSSSFPLLLTFCPIHFDYRISGSLLTVFCIPLINHSSASGIYCHSYCISILASALVSFQVGNGVTGINTASMFTEVHLYISMPPNCHTFTSITSLCLKQCYSVCHIINILLLSTFLHSSKYLNLTQYLLVHQFSNNWCFVSPKL